MKNIIKRGTSLLLVLAMLLSFAAVVGAEEPTTTTSEKILTLTVEDAVVKAGETTYIPAYVQGSTDNIIMSMNLSAISENSAVQITGVYPAKPLRWDGDDWEYDESTKGVLTLSGATAAAPETKKPLLTWAVSKKKDGFTATAEKQLLCYIEVLATETTTAQVSLCAKPGAEESMFATYVEGAHVDSHSKNKVEFISGTAVVIPADATLPTVILTQSSFAAPTMATYDPEQGVDLLNYLKIVDRDGNLHAASSAADTSIRGNYVSNGELKLMPSSGNSGTIIVENLHAADDESITASATLAYTVTKDAVRTPWRAGFSTSKGVYKTQEDFNADFAKNPPKAPAYGGAEHNSTYVNPNVFDQYGAVMEGYSFVPLVTLYDAADHTTPLANEEGNADPAYSAVYFNYNEITGKWASSTLYYTKELKKDVWCKIELGVIGPDGEKANIPADTLEFLIQSQYPQAASATVVLGDMNGNEFPSGPVTTIDIPYGTTENKTFSIIVKDFRQADGETMPEGTEPSATDVTIALDGTYTGVSISNDNKLVIDKTAQAGTVTVKATLNGKELGTLTLTLQKAASVVTELKLYDRATGKPKDGTEIEIKSGVTNGKATLPGIRANDELVLEFEPVCAIDQYGDIVQTKHAVDGGYANRDYLSTLDYALYKYDETAEEYKTFTTNVVRTVDTTTGVLKLTLKNELDKDTNELLIPEGKYCLKTWANSFPDCKTMLSSAEFELVKGASVYDTLEVTADETSVKVPYAYGTTEQMTQQYLTLTVNAKDQYGRAIDASKITDLALDESTVWVGGNAIGGILPVAKDQHTTTASNVLRLEVKPSAGENMKTNLTADLEVTLTFKVDGTAKRIEKTKVTTLTKDESVLSTAAVRVGETAGNWNVVDFYSNVMLAKKEQTVNLIAPKDATKSYKISILNCDQYGTKLDGQQYEVTAPEDGSIAIVDQTYTHDDLTVTTAAANKELVISFPNAATPTWKVTIKVVPMEFVKSETGKNDTFKLGDYLTNDTLSAEYNGQPWSTILTTKPNVKVYIKTAEGEQNTPIDDDNLSLEVTKDGEPVDQTQKANAGTYKVKLVYTDNNQTYTVDEKTFKIEPKKVRIVLDTGAKIEKEYDGTANLPDVTLAVTAYETLNVDKSVLKFAQENVGTDINVELTSADANCLKTASGEPATNYTADPSELKGTITPRQLTVTPKAETFEYGENDKITTALTTEFDYAGKNGDLPSGLTPSFTGSMVLTQSNAEVQSPYNAGDYYPRQGTLAVNSNNYEISEFKTTVNGTEIKWVVSPKTVDPFDVTLQAEYGINGSELYAMLNTAKVTVDGKEVNLSTVYNVNVLDIEDAGKNKVSRTGTDAVNAGEYTVTNWTLTTLGKNYTFNKVPTLKIKVKPHELTDADVQLSGETSAGFDGTEKSVMVKVSFTYGGREVTLTKDTDYTLTGEVEASNAGGHYLTVTAKPNGNLSGSVQKRWQIWPYEIQPGDLTFKLKSGVTFTYDTTPKKPQKSDVTWDVTATDAKRKAFLKKYFTEDDFNLDCLARTDAGDYTASASMRHNFVKSKETFKMSVSWTIGKSSVTPLSNQTAKTKYGQPGSLTVTLSEGQYKGLTNGAWTVRDIGDIFESAVAEYKDGVATINWKLKDTTKAGDTGSFKVIVPASTNYEGYEFTVTVNVTAKDAQTGFGFTYANPIVGYAEDTYTNPVQNAKTTPVYTSSKPAVATVDSNGVVTILDVGETVITANAPENGEYASATDSYTLTVVPSTLTVTASSATMTANDSVPSFTASVTGLKRGQTTAQVFQALTASAATDGKTAGTYAVNASATLKTDFVPRYTLRFVPGTLTVNPAVTVIDTVLPIIIGGNTCANGYANCACESFYDLDASRWYHEAIDWAYSLGLMNGTTKSTFGPNAAATRAQTWTMLARIAGQDTRRSSTWYEVGQKWAMNLGITDGTNPMGSLTREQLAAMLYRYVGSPAVNGTLTFTDSANVSTWARNAMIWAVQNGILDGVGGNRLNPKGTTTRAQAAAIFMRFSKLINK